MQIKVCTAECDVTSAKQQVSVKLFSAVSFYVFAVSFYVFAAIRIFEN